jgi:hypothetical protein
MKWRWQIPDVYLSLVHELGKHKHPLHEAMLRLQNTETGQLPQTFEIYPDIFLWRQYGYRITYERLREQRLLLLSSIEKM